MKSKGCSTTCRTGKKLDQKERLFCKKQKNKNRNQNKGKGFSENLQLFGKAKHQKSERRERLFRNYAEKPEKSEQTERLFQKFRKRYVHVHVRVDHNARVCGCSTELCKISQNM